MLHVAKIVNQSELASYRKRYLAKDRMTAVAQGSVPVSREVNPETSGVQVTGTDVTFNTERDTPRGVRDTFTASLEFQTNFIRKSRQDLKNMVAFVRQTEPGLLAGMSDEQAVDLLVARARQKAEESVKRVFTKMGRSRELAIKTAGW